MNCDDSSAGSRVTRDIGVQRNFLEKIVTPGGGKKVTLRKCLLRRRNLPDTKGKNEGEKVFSITKAIRENGGASEEENNFINLTGAKLEFVCWFWVGFLGGKGRGGKKGWVSFSNSRLFTRRSSYR